MKKLDEEMIVEGILKERIIESKELFNEKELKFIKNNSIVIKKVYLLGILDSKFQEKN